MRVVFWDEYLVIVIRSKTDVCYISDLLRFETMINLLQPSAKQKGLHNKSKSQTLVRGKGISLIACLFNIRGLVSGHVKVFAIGKDQLPTGFLCTAGVQLCIPLRRVLLEYTCLFFFSFILIIFLIKSIRPVWNDLTLVNYMCVCCEVYFTNIYMLTFKTYIWIQSTSQVPMSFEKYCKLCNPHR